MSAPATFLHEALPARVLFGRGTLAALPEELDRLGITRALILSTPEQAALAEAVRAQVGGKAAGVFAGARMHTPVEVTEQARAEADRIGCDGLVAIGGGSTIGLGKAIALRTGLPQIVIPTTYAGSEVTPVIGETAGGEKTTQRTLDVLPETVIYDVDLTLGLPQGMSVTSGLNAIAHAAEALYAPDVSPIVAMMAEEGVRSLYAALPAIMADAGDVAARTQALYGAWLCGTCLGLVGMALHHKLCHVLGGSFGLPHAETHSVILPHALAYNLAAAPEARERLARAVGHDDPALALHDLARKLGAPLSLREIGMAEGDVAKAAALAVGRPYPNPRAFDEAAMAGLLRRAWAGQAPTDAPA